MLNIDPAASDIARDLDLYVKFNAKDPSLGMIREKLRQFHRSILAGETKSKTRGILNRIRRWDTMKVMLSVTALLASVQKTRGHDFLHERQLELTRVTLERDILWVTSGLAIEQDVKFAPKRGILKIAPKGKIVKRLRKSK